MKSRKFPLYYLLFALTTIILLICSLFLLKDTVHAGLFGPEIIVFAILFNPVYICWVLLTVVIYILSRFVKSETGIQIYNWILLALPFILLALFIIIITLR